MQKSTSNQSRQFKYVSEIVQQMIEEAFACNNENPFLSLSLLLLLTDPIPGL